MPVPSKDIFRKIAEDFERQWNFPNCCGAIDGKHVRIKRPAHSGTMFFNYKHFFSIVLQGVADSYYKFIFIDVGAYGKQSDGGIYDSSLLNKFISEEKNFPADRYVPGAKIQLPYTFLCDDAYPLKRNMMKPFSGPNLTPQQDIYNGRLSRARRCVECAFGILVNKWRLLLKSIETNEETAGIIVNCATVLHNIVIERDGVDENLLQAVTTLLDSTELQNRSLETGRRYNRKSSSALAIRDAWKEYFNSSLGSVPWQDRYRKH